MKIPLVDLKAQLDSIEGEINEAIHRVLQSGQFILGDEVRTFEEEMASDRMTNQDADIVWRDIVNLPNLFSLARIALIPLLGYYLTSPDQQATIICVVLIAIAGITDGLDGMLARRLGRVTRLGIALDPIADKLFAGALVILLIAYRGFPIWLASVIIGRDLLILIAGLILLRGRKVVVPSNLTGKYTFAATVILLLSYVLRFEFGAVTTTWLVTALIAASLINYTRVFVRVRADRAVPEFRDSRTRQVVRVAITSAYSIVWLVRFATDVLGW